MSAEETSLTCYEQVNRPQEIVHLTIILELQLFHFCYTFEYDGPAMQEAFTIIGFCISLFSVVQKKKNVLIVN